MDWTNGLWTHGQHDQDKSAEKGNAKKPVGVKNIHLFPKVQENWDGAAATVSPMPPLNNNLKNTTKSLLQPRALKDSTASGANGGVGGLDYPAQYHTIRAARWRAASTATLGGVGDYARSADLQQAQDMGFLISGDGRGFEVSNFHRTDVGRNISISATADFECLACARAHSYKDSVAAGKPLVAVLSDQGFPPMILSGRGDCVMVIRVDDGLLSEIESTFFDYVFGGGMTESGLPVGSVIMIGSVTHLGT